MKLPCEILCVLQWQIVTCLYCCFLECAHNLMYSTGQNWKKQPGTDFVCLWKSSKPIKTSVFRGSYLTQIDSFWLVLIDAGAGYYFQAVVVSIDPRRIYVNDPSETPFRTIQVSKPGMLPSSSRKVNLL